MIRFKGLLKMPTLFVFLNIELGAVFAIEQVQQLIIVQLYHVHLAVVHATVCI